MKAVPRPRKAAQRASEWFWDHGARRHWDRDRRRRIAALNQTAHRKGKWVRS